MKSGAILTLGRRLFGQITRPEGTIRSRFLPATDLAISVGPVSTEIEPTDAKSVWRADLVARSDQHGAVLAVGMGADETAAIDALSVVLAELLTARVEDDHKALELHAQVFSSPGKKTLGSV